MKSHTYVANFGVISGDWDVDGKSVYWKGKWLHPLMDTILRLRVFAIASPFHYNLPSLHSRSVPFSTSKESIPQKRGTRKTYGSHFMF
jgi:hypothetical protein